MNNDVKLESYNSVCFHNFIFFITCLLTNSMCCCNSFMFNSSFLFQSSLDASIRKNVIILAKHLGPDCPNLKLCLAIYNICSLLLPCHHIHHLHPARTPPDCQPHMPGAQLPQPHSRFSVLSKLSARDQEADVPPSRHSQPL